MITKLPKYIDGEASAAKLMNVALKKAEEAIQKQGGDAEDIIRCALFSLSYLAVKIATNSVHAKDTVFDPDLMYITPKTTVDYELAKLEG